MSSSSVKVGFTDITISILEKSQSLHSFEAMAPKSSFACEGRRCLLGTIAQFVHFLAEEKNIGTQCVLELFCEMLIMLIRQGEVRKWLNGESFICSVFRFCYVAGGV